MPYIDSGSTYFKVMKLPQHTFEIIETDELEQAINLAQELWPELGTDRTAYLHKILELGAEVIHKRFVALKRQE